MIIFVVRLYGLLGNIVWISFSADSAFAVLIVVTCRFNNGFFFRNFVRKGFIAKALTACIAKPIFDIAILCTGCRISVMLYETVSSCYVSIYIAVCVYGRI